MLKYVNKILNMRVVMIILEISTSLGLFKLLYKKYMIFLKISFLLMMSFITVSSLNIFSTYDKAFAITIYSDEISCNF